MCAKDQLVFIALSLAIVELDPLDRRALVLFILVLVIGRASWVAPVPRCWQCRLWLYCQAANAADKGLGLV